jgi:hypothetical protein
VNGDTLHPQFFQLKRLARKRSQPLYAYKVNWEELPQDLLGKVFNIHSLEDWSQISHIVVNEDGLKIPVTLAEGETTGAMAHRFISNPAKVRDLEEVYDAFEVNKGSNVKYVMVCNPGGHSSPSEMTLQQKLFRKFFYENSGFIESEVKFVEVTNERVA